MRRRGSKVVSCTDRFAVKEAKDVLSRGGFVVAPTDTIYGILADATSYPAIRRLYKLRRPSGKPFIVLLPSLIWAEKLGLELTEKAVRLLSTPFMTVVLRKKGGLFSYLGTRSLAVRHPRRGFVYRLLQEFKKPVVAPSANMEGEPPAKNISEAISYFGEEVSLYVDCGSVKGRASTLVSLLGDKPKVLRSGPYSVLSLKRLLRD